MKVLYLTNVPSPYRVEFFNSLGKECELTVLFERVQATDRNKEWKTQIKNFNAIYLRGMKSGTDTAFCPSIIKWLKRGSFDIVVVGGYSTFTGMLAILTLNIKKIPFVLNADGGIINETSTIKNKLKNKLKKYFISSASYWLSPSSTTDEYFREYGACDTGIYQYSFSSMLKSEILMFPINPIDKLAFREELGLSDNKTVISVGQFIYRKGFEVLINSWVNVNKNYNLLIIGEGELKQSYLDLIERLNLENVKLVGFQKKRRVVKIL